jgi:hypothetical protein
LGADLIVEQSVTQETVKSAASQSVLDDYIRRFDEVGKYSRLIFVCLPTRTLDPGEREDVMVWTRAALAETAIQHGLVDWLVERAG